MDKKCLVIMPASEPDGYAKGHFDRVYQYIIVPACRFAGFSPSRAYDPVAPSAASDILKNIIESEIAICDLSTKNPNALYALAIRQALNLPVVLMKDAKTWISFSTLDLGMVEYDESLRIDTVQKEVEAMSDVLTKTFNNRAITNSLLSRFDIPVNPSEESQNAAAADIQPEEIHKVESHLPVISPLPDYVGEAISQHEDFDKLKVGDFVFHMNYGKGEIKAVNKMAKDRIARIQFESGTKLLVLATSGIFRKINN